MYKSIYLNEYFRLEKENENKYIILNGGKECGTLTITKDYHRIIANLKINENELSEKECECVTSEIIDWLKFFGDRQIFLTTKNDRKIILLKDNEYFYGIPLIVEQMAEAEKFLTEQKKFWMEEFTNDLFYDETEYGKLVKNQEIPMSDILYGNRVLWAPILFGENKSLKLSFDKNGIDLSYGAWGKECYASFFIKGRNKMHISIPSLNKLRIKEKDLNDLNLLYNREIQIDTSELSIRLFLDKDNTIIKSHVCVYINKKNGKTKGTYHIDFNKFTGFETYYTSRHGKNTPITITNPELWELTNTHELKPKDLKRIIDLYLEAINQKTVDELLSIEELKHLTPELPVPIIRDSLSNICYIISPKKTKERKRTRKQ